jgi:L-ascorbate metabolism protein UlaG (beta-lactamase superfamily)
MIRVHGKNILIDPMFGPDTTPIAPMPTIRFSDNTLDIIDSLPEIDLVMITHDHYDHLDLASIEKLNSKVKEYYVALGVGRHLEAWGVSGSCIAEFDWWDGITWAGIDIFFTPTRHFSGRGIKDRSMSLWGGWVLNTGTENIWISGDGGYGKHFSEIGERLGPFDLAFMECGQYNSDWHEMHMFPDESVQAAVDAGVNKAIPIHWGAFSLSYQHTWYEPVEHFILSAHTSNMPFSSPPLGKVFSIEVEELDQWWLPYV